MFGNMNTGNEGRGMKKQDVWEPIDDCLVCTYEKQVSEIGDTGLLSIDVEDKIRRKQQANAAAGQLPGIYGTWADIVRMNQSNQ